MLLRKDTLDYLPRKASVQRMFVRPLARYSHTGIEVREVVELPYQMTLYSADARRRHAFKFGFQTSTKQQRKCDPLHAPASWLAVPRREALKLKIAHSYTWQRRETQLAAELSWCGPASVPGLWGNMLMKWKTFCSECHKSKVLNSS